MSGRLKAFVVSDFATLSWASAEYARPGSFFKGALKKRKRTIEVWSGSQADSKNFKPQRIRTVFDVSSASTLQPPRKVASLQLTQPVLERRLTRWTCDEHLTSQLSSGKALKLKVPAQPGSQTAFAESRVDPPVTAILGQLSPHDGKVHLLVDALVSRLQLAP